MSEKMEKPTSPRIREIKEEESKTKPQSAVEKKQEQQLKDSKTTNTTNTTTTTNTNTSSTKDDKKETTTKLFKMPSLTYVKTVCGNRCFALLFMIKQNIQTHAILNGMQEPYKVTMAYKLSAEEKKYINEKLTALGYQVLFKSVPPPSQNASKTNETETKAKTESEPGMTVEVHLDGE